VGRAAKDALFDAFASVAQALGSGRRAQIVDLLAQGERSVEEIATEIDQSVANTSHHLQLLLRAGLVRSRREGTRIYYRLASDRIGDLWAAVREVAERHVAEVHILADDYLGERDGVESIAADQLQARLANGTEPDTSRGRCRRRSTRSTPWPRSCGNGARSSRTAAVPTASTPTTPSGCCSSEG